MAPRRWRNRELPTEIVRRGDDLARVVGLSYGDVKRLLPFWHQGVDRRGRPFLIAQCGAVDFRELFAKVDLEAVCRFQALQSETFVKFLGETRADRWTVLVDRGVHT